MDMGAKLWLLQLNIVDDYSYMSVESELDNHNKRVYLAKLKQTKNTHLIVMPIKL